MQRRVTGSLCVIGGRAAGTWLEPDLEGVFLRLYLKVPGTHERILN